MRAFLVATSLFVAALAACTNSTGAPCQVSADCDAPNERCIDGACVARGALPVVGEGEGEGTAGGEGEGEGTAPGEGEGVVAEGEGEGVIAEGEGEGSPAPCATVTCGAFQECQPSTGICEYVGTVCDAFGAPTTVSIFSDTTGTLSSTDPVYGVAFGSESADRERAIDAFIVDTSVLTTATATVRAQLSKGGSGSLDPMLVVMDETLGQCTELGANDDSAGLNADLKSTIGRDADVRLVATSFYDPTDPSGQGAYALRVRPLLCGGTKETGGTVANNIVNNDVASSLGTFLECAPRYTDAASCEASNSCAHDAAGNNTGFFCCTKSNCATNFPALADGRVYRVSDPGGCHAP